MKEMIVAMALGAALAVILVHSLDAEMELRERAMQVQK